MVASDRFFGRMAATLSGMRRALEGARRAERWGPGWKKSLHKTPNPSEAAGKAGDAAPAGVPLSNMMDSFLSGSSSNYVEVSENKARSSGKKTGSDSSM